MMLKVKTGTLLGDVNDLKNELYTYIEVVKNETLSPVEENVMDLMEVSTAYYVRAKEMEAMIFDAESDGDTELKAFRTGFLRTCIEIFKSTKDLGSRRVTAAKDLLDEMLGN